MLQAKISCYINNYYSDAISKFAVSVCGGAINIYQFFFLILQKDVRNSGVNGTNPMNIPKALDCLPHDLLSAKVYTSSVDPSVFS